MITAPRYAPAWDLPAKAKQPIQIWTQFGTTDQWQSFSRPLFTPNPIPPEPDFELGTTVPTGQWTGRPSTGRPAMVTVDGDLTINTGGTEGAPLIIEDKYIKGRVIINAAWVIVRYCVIEGRTGGAFVGEGLILLNAGATNCFIFRNTLAQNSTTAVWYVNGIKISAGATGTIERNDISRVVDGVYANGNGGWFKIYGNFHHDFMFRNDDSNQSASTPPSWSHNDGLQLRGGSNWDVVGNYYRMTFADDVGMPTVANPSGTPPFLWRNCHGMLVQPVQSAVTFTFTKNFFAYGSIAIQFADNGPYTTTGTMLDNQVVINQSLEYSTRRQFLVDSPGTKNFITGIPTTKYMDHPDNPSAIIGLTLRTIGSGSWTGPTNWAYNPTAATPAPNGPSKPFI